MAPVTTSHARVRGARKGPAFLSILLLIFTSNAAEAGVAVEMRDGMIAIAAENTTLRSVLEALADEDVVDVSASIPLLSPVTLASGPEPLSRLIKRLLRPYSYTLIEYDATSGRLPRLHVFADSDPGAPISWAARSAARVNPIDQAIADLANPDEDVREEAILVLSDTGDPYAVAHFLAALSDASRHVREAARAALEDMDTAFPEGQNVLGPSSESD